MTEAKAKKKMGLTSKVLLGLLLGAIVGVILNTIVPSGFIKDDVLINGVFYVIGQGFIRLLKMLVVPLVFTSLVCGSMAIGDPKKLGSIGVRTILFYLLTTALAITVALIIANIINPGIGLDMSSIQASTDVQEIASTSVKDTILNIIPTNIFESFTTGTMLQVIFFALFIGVLLAHMNDRTETIQKIFTEFNDLMMTMTMAVMKISPYGVFCLIAGTFATLGIDAFLPLIKYMAAVLVALAIQALLVYPSLLKALSGLSPVVFLKKFFPVMAFAFSTATSNATIPLNIETLDNKLGVARKISSFTIPLGATINMDGTAIMQGVAVVFAAQAYGLNLSMQDYLIVIGTATLASVGTAGIPSVGLVTLTMVFSAIGLPVEAIALIMGIDRLLDMTRTAVNITGDAICTTIIAKANNAINLERYYDMKIKDPEDEELDLL